MLLRGYIHSYTDGVVTMSGVSISPKLNINVGRIDFASENNVATPQFSGFSRSTEISWSLKSGQPFLVFDFGPTLLKNLLVAERIMVQTPPLTEVDWQNLNLSGTADNVEYKSFTFVDNLILEGDFNYESLKASDLYFELNKVEALSSGQPLSVGSVRAVLDEVNLDVAVGSQNFNSKFQAIDDLGEIKNLKVELKDVLLPNMSDISSVSEIMIEVNKTDDNQYDVFVVGNASEFELYWASSFVGSIPPSRFKIDLELDTLKSQVAAKSTINLDTLKLPAISGEAKVKFRFDSMGDLVQCNIGGCSWSEVDLNYQINFGDEWVKGRSFCSGLPCELRTMKNSLTTSDTADILAVINRAGILNPLYSFYLYSLVSSGQKIGPGHQLKF